MANFDVNYDDERFKDVETEKSNALADVETQYQDMINDSDTFYTNQIAEVNRWTEEQKKLQQEQTDLALEKIEQQKDQAHQDYIKEQRASYVDYQKQIDPYGVESEKMVAAGLGGSGYSESSKVRMYTTYQNRVATARDVYNRAVLNYDNAMKDAILQNNVALAQLAHDGLMKELELSLEGFQYKNSLITEQTNKKLEVDQMYYQRWQDVLNQINTENSLKEQARQFDAEMASRAAELAEEKRQYDLSLAEEKRQFDVSASGGSGGTTGGSGGSGGSGGISGGSGGSGNYGSLVKSSSSNVGNYNLYSNGLSTPYYQGAYNADRSTYGTFDNGYQPKGITGHGKLKDTGDYVTVKTVVQYGDQKGKQLSLTQKLWKAEDGTLWYWEGRQNKYLQYGTEGGGGKGF